MTVQSTEESSFKFWAPIAYTRFFLYSQAAILRSTFRWISGKTPKGMSLMAAWTISVLRLCMNAKLLSIHQARKLLTITNFIVGLQYGVSTKRGKAKWAHPVQAPGWEGYWIPYREEKLQGPVRKATVEDIGKECDIVIFAIHGGGMVMGDALMWLANYKNWIKLMREKYNIKIGILSVEYTLSPEARWPVAIDECIAAYRFLVEHQNIDPRRIVMSGDSAGGNLCLTAALKMRDNFPHILPAAQVLYSPWVMCPQPMKNSDDDYITGEGGQVFINSYTGGDAQVRASPYASPIGAPTLAGMPKMLIYIGGAESLRPSIERFVKKGKAEGLDITVSFKEGQAHDYALIPEISSHKIVREADQVMAQFIAKVHTDYVGA
ncbi:hypothetical protein BGW41_005905 [Actinomortierella wolfii]|nr:hypothetical protein BGW41_005905 [Actinomortierella wolfii]